MRFQPGEERLSHEKAFYPGRSPGRGVPDRPPDGNRIRHVQLCDERGERQGDPLALRPPRSGDRIVQHQVRLHSDRHRHQEIQHHFSHGEQRRDHRTQLRRTDV